MPTLLERVNRMPDLTGAIETDSVVFAHARTTLACTPATAAVATTFNVLAATGEDEGINTDNAADPADPANNQVNY